MNLTQDEFKEKVIESKGIVLVDFWAEWCGPCRMLSPLLEEIEKEHKGKFTLYKVDVDQNGELSQMFHVHSIPTVIVFKDGKPNGQFVGVQPKENYVKVIEELERNSGML